MTPITLAHDEQITKPGVYRIPIQRYHNDPDLCDGPSISSSGLRAILDCPAKYWAHSPYNPDRRDPPPKQVFTIGKAAHAIILEGELPEDEFVISPYGEHRTKEAREWKASMEAEGIAILKESELAEITDMHKALLADPLIPSMFEGEIECSLVFQDEETGIWIKNRPDAIPNDDTLADLKFVADASTTAIWRDVTKYRYHMQMALGGLAMRKVLGRKIQNYALVFCEKTWPHVTNIAALDSEAIIWGHRQNRLAINEFARRMKDKDWPGYELGPVTVSLTDFEKKRLKNMGALLPEAEKDLEDA